VERSAKVPQRLHLGQSPLFKPLLVLNIDAEQTVFVANGNQRIFTIQSPFKAKDLFGGTRKIRYIGNGDLPGYLLFER
jgi:hypothetical protein